MIYNITFPKFATRMLPPDKRNPILSAFLTALLSPLQWLNQYRIVEFGLGSSAANWSAIITYNKYDQAIYNKTVYQSLINGNTTLPTSANWTVSQNNFIGLNERIQYNGSALVLTYALNKWFGTTFRQPNAISDVYITPGAVVLAGFFVAATNGSDVGLTTSSATIGGRSAFSTPINFIIHVPALVYAGTTGLAIREFANKYIPVSINYSITTY